MCVLKHCAIIQVSGEEIARVRGKKIIVTAVAGAWKQPLLPTLGPGKVVGMDIDRETGQQAADAACSFRMPQPLSQSTLPMPNSVNSAFDHAVEWLGGELHVLAHPAAIQAASDPATVSASEWDRMFAVNVG